MDCSPPGSPVHGISQEEYWSGLPCPSPGDLPDSWDWTHVSCIGRQILYLWATSSVQSLSHVWLFATPWTSACQASLSITNFRSSLRITSIKSVIPFSYLILCHPLLLLPPIPPSIRVFSNESTLRMRWPKYWSFSFSIILSKEYTILYVK